MTEEQLTKHILSWLIDNHWKILAYDFPQSGTGIMIHPDEYTGHKNKECINPDIICVKNEVCLFFENKNRIYLDDFLKQNELINENKYMKDILQILEKEKVSHIFYGIGLPENVNKNIIDENKHLVDFIVTVSNDQKKIEFFHHNCIISNIFFE